MTTMPGGDAAPLPLLVMAVRQEIEDMGLSLLMALTGSTVGEAAAHPHLFDLWSARLPEARAGLLVSAAWAARGKTLDLDGRHTHAAGYATDLQEYAGAATDRATFHGPRYPAMPLFGQAGALASSLAFDRDDLAISLETALILMYASTL